MAMPILDKGLVQIWLDDLDCSGSESTLLQCSHRRLGSHNCDHSEDVSVRCSGNRSEITYFIDLEVDLNQSGSPI